MSQSSHFGLFIPTHF